MAKHKKVDYLLNEDFIKVKRFRAIDGLRGLACIAVIVYHFGAPYNTYYLSAEPAPYSFNLGDLGVQLFFIISGYVILLSAIKTKNAIGFAISRFSSLYPAYWISLIVSSAVIFLVGFDNRSITFKQVLVNFTMFQRFLRVDNVDQVYWTLAVEMQFYILFYFLISKGNINSKIIKLFSFIWLIIGLITCIIFYGSYNSGIGKLAIWILLSQHSALFLPGYELIYV